MMVHVYIREHRLMALVDSGSSHNFIHTDLISGIGLATSCAKL
jgi:hypothetical protein